MHRLSPSFLHQHSPDKIWNGVDDNTPIDRSRAFGLGQNWLLTVLCLNAANVAVGSNSEVELADADFRFTPESRHPAVRLGCPFRATTRPARASDRILHALA